MTKMSSWNPHERVSPEGPVIGKILSVGTAILACIMQAEDVVELDGFNTTLVLTTIFQTERARQKRNIGLLKMGQNC